MHVYLAMFVVESHARDASSIHLFSASLILLLFFFFSLHVLHYRVATLVLCDALVVL